MIEPVLAPEVVRRNRILGLILGAVVFAIGGFFMYQFTHRGLPPDPDVFRQMAEEGTSGHPLGESPGTVTIPAAPLPSAAPQEPAP